LILYPPTPLKEGARLYYLPTSQPEVDVQPELKCSIAFEQIGGAQFEAVIPFFAKAIAEVGRIVEIFQKQFF
jgi:hypothetical protein